MTRIPLTLLMVFSLAMAFGCAMKPAKSATTTAPALQQRPADDSLRGTAGEIHEETIVTAPQRAITTEGLSAQGKESLAGLQIVPFAYDQHLLSDDAKRIIAANAAILKDKGNISFQLAGHCDERGSDQYNIALGERRAEAVRAYLLELGIPSKRMETVSYGEERPLVVGSNENCWIQNRRVEFVLLP